MVWSCLGCGDDAEPERCAIPSSEFVVKATPVASLCAPRDLSAGTFYESFSTGTRNYPGKQCSATRSLSDDACTLTLEERCLDDAGTGVATHLTRYQLGNPDALTGTRYTYVDSASGHCSAVETLQGTPR